MYTTCYLKTLKRKKKTLLILDDVGASLKRNDIQTILKKIIFNRRHLKVHIVCLLQLTSKRCLSLNLCSYFYFTKATTDSLPLLVATPVSTAVTLI